jgi:NADP+-dependent farnesol dehydrogenase
LQSISPGITRTGIAEASKTPIEVLENFKDFPSLEPVEIANAVLYVLGTPPHVQVIMPHVTQH